MPPDLLPILDYPALFVATLAVAGVATACGWLFTVVFDRMWQEIDAPVVVAHEVPARPQDAPNATHDTQRRAA